MRTKFTKALASGLLRWRQWASVFLFAVVLVAATDGRPLWQQGAIIAALCAAVGLSRYEPDDATQTLPRPPWMVE